MCSNIISHIRNNAKSRNTWASLGNTLDNLEGDTSIEEWRKGRKAGKPWWGCPEDQKASRVHMQWPARCRHPICGLWWSDKYLLHFDKSITYFCCSNLQSLAVTNKIVFHNCLVAMWPKSTKLDMPTTHNILNHLYNKFIQWLQDISTAIEVSWKSLCWR
jgi:hypothetical protein